MRHYSYNIYVISNKCHSTLYIGVTNDIMRRKDEHRRGVFTGFSKKYHLKHQLYFEECDDIAVAIALEKQLKRWHRSWKMDLIRSMNPHMVDLAEDLFASGDAETSV